LRQNVAMNELLVLVRGRLLPGKREAALAALRSAAAAGVFGKGTRVSAWESLEEPDEFALFEVFQGERALERHLENMASSPLLLSLSEAVELPVDARSFVLNGSPAVLTGASVGDYASLSVRDTEPGLAAEVEAELDRIFAELRVIDGFVGSIRGRNLTLDEEVLGVAIWTSVEAYMKSLPSHPLYAVNIYRRVA
jgi:quinol monooxygenase YgiN